MLEVLVAFILMTAILMSGLRRINLLNTSYAVLSLLIALICLVKGLTLHDYHYYILFILTIIAKVMLVPNIISKSVRNLKLNRETELIISGFWSYIISGVAVVLTFGLLSNYSSIYFKSGIVLMVVGAMLLIARKKAITQMIGLLTMENGIVLFEISLVKMGPFVEAGIVFEMFVLALIMGMMIFRINKVFDSVNTDQLSNLKE